MASDDDTALQARLESLRRAFYAKVPQMVSDLQQAIRDLDQAADDHHATALDTVRRQAHRTAGTAATYGLSEFATAHRRIEQAAGAGGRPPDLDEIKAGLAEVERLAATIAPSDAVSGGGA